MCTRPVTARVPIVCKHFQCVVCCVSPWIMEIEAMKDGRDAKRMRPGSEGAGEGEEGVGGVGKRNLES